MNDFIVFGASGFTAKKVILYLSRLKYKFSVAGRNPTKIESRLPNGIKVDIIRADVSEYESLLNMTKQCKVLINCVGPFALYGEPVIKACIETKTNYVDITGEPFFIESTILKYDELAQAAGVTLVPACGFDCMPTEMGLVWIKNNVEYPATVEMFFQLRSGYDGSAGNYGTYESLVNSLAQKKELSEVRKKLNQKLPKAKCKGPPLKFSYLPYYETRVKSWVIPFVFADPAVVRLSQKMVESEKKWDKSIQGRDKPRSVQFAAYVQVSFATLIAVIFLGLVLNTLSGFKWGRKFLIEYGEYITAGGFKKSGPTEAQIMGTDFKSTFIVKGYLKEDSWGKEDFEAKFSVVGPEPGYVTTPICVVESAIVMLEERKRIPFGVMTPSVAFGGTTLIERLQSAGIKFDKE